MLYGHFGSWKHLLFLFHTSHDHRQHETLPSFPNLSSLCIAWERKASEFVCILSQPFQLIRIKFGVVLKQFKFIKPRLDLESGLQGSAWKQTYPCEWSHKRFSLDGYGMLLRRQSDESHSHLYIYRSLFKGENAASNGDGGRGEDCWICIST